MKSTAREKPQGCAGKVWVPKWGPWNVLAGKSENIRFAVAEMRRAINEKS